VVPAERHRLARNQASNDLGGFIQSLDPNRRSVVGDACAVVLAASVPCTKTEFKAATREIGERHSFTRKHGRARVG
jgi:hypothetical protein